jgi:hypothetical protein
MSQQVLRGYAWYAYPEVFGLEDERPSEPGHPFTSPSGEVRPPDEVVYFRTTDPADAGVHNARRDQSFLVLSRTPFHPRLGEGWESEPAALTDKFKTKDGKVRMARIIQTHKRHAGDLIECELKAEEG